MFDLHLIHYPRRDHSAAMHGLRFIAGLLSLALPILAAGAELSDEQIQQKLIEQSVANYRGNCPCPYNVDRAGRKCGRRSAYNRHGGYAPLCYPTDITAEMIASFRDKH